MRNSGYQKTETVNHLSETELDAALESQPQTVVRDVVRGLSDHEPSMTWRRGLNQKLLVEAARRKKAVLFGWVWKPAAGVALAGALAFAFLLRTEPNFIPSGRPASDNSLEAALIATHRENGGGFSEVTGAGLTPSEYFVDQTKGPVDDPVWQEFDPGTL